MERIRKKGKQHDSADVTFRIVQTTDENWQARSDASESVCSQLLFVVISYAAVNLKLFQEVESHVLSNLDGHQHALNEYMCRRLFMFCVVSKALSQISFSIQLINTIRRAHVIILFIIKSMFTLVFCLQTIKRKKHHLIQMLFSVNGLYR